MAEFIITNRANGDGTHIQLVWDSTAETIIVRTLDADGAATDLATAQLT